MQLLKDVVRELLGYGRLRSQNLFQRLYFHSIYGMNYASPNFVENGEISALKYVSTALRKAGYLSPTVFDVGANVGNYALELRNIFGPDAQILCFEPSVSTFNELARKTNHDPRIKCFQFGFGERAETCELIANPNMSCTASLYDLPENHCWKGTQVENIAINTIDEFCSQEQIKEIAFLKVDVEGHELPVLRGAVRTISEGKVRFIQFEFGFRQMDSKNYFRDFFDLLNEQYRLYRIVKDGLVSISKYDEGLEIFVGVSNYLAERRVDRDSSFGH